MTGRVTPADVDSYSEGIKELSELFPDAWGLIHQADEVMRSEVWARVHEDMLVQPIDGVSTSNPWGWVLRSSAFGSECVRFLQFWQRRVTLPLTTRTASAATRLARELERAPVDVFAYAGGSTSTWSPPTVPPRPKAEAKARAVPPAWQAERERVKPADQGQKGSKKQAAAAEEAPLSKRALKRLRKGGN